MRKLGTHIRGRDELASFPQHEGLRVFGRHEDLDHLGHLHVWWRHRGRGTLQEGAAAMALDCGGASWLEEKV